MTSLGIYEKALPKSITWPERLKLAKTLGFDFVEMSIDESDDRLARLDWNKAERLELVEAMFETGVTIQSICLSGHRRYPLGSSDPLKRQKADEIMDKAIQLAVDLGVRIIQLAGYDVYYEEKSLLSRELFIEGIKRGVALASQKGVILSIEIMDDPFLNSITKFKQIKEQIASPYLQVYPDLGNLSAWPENNPGYELELGVGDISAVHIKDTLPVTETFPGKFKEVPFGEGHVDFLGCLKTLKRLGFSGPFLIEMWTENSEYPEADIREAKEFLLPIFKEAGYFGKQ